MKRSEILERLSKHSKPQLLELLKELYDLDEETRLFFETRLSKSTASLKPYKKRVQKALTADPICNEELEWALADKAIEQYRIASGNEEGVAELLVYAVEMANEFTLEYGDIDEGYYESVEELFQEAIDHLLALQENKMNIDAHIEGLRDVVASTDGIGWGYHDALTDMFYAAFGKA